MIKEINAITPEYLKHRLKEQEEYYKEEIERLNNIINKKEKINKIGEDNYKWNYKYDIKTPQAVVDNLELVRQKINEIIDEINKKENK